MKHSTPRQPRPTRRARQGVHRRGLTLLELVVVLVILAALGTVIITQTTSLTGEARFQQTTRTMDQLQDAVIGREPVGAEDPTGIPPGFVSDMGRLPVAVEIDSVLTLAELWDAERFEESSPGAGDDRFFGPRALTGLDDDLEMLSGWRGPYVRLSVGSGELRDGWGGAFELEDDGGAALAADRETIGSVGSGGPGAGDDFDPAVPFEVVFVDTAEGIDRTRGSLLADAVTVDCVFSAVSTTPTIDGVVRLYGISDGLPVLLLQSEPFTAAGSPGTTTTVSVTFDDPDNPGTALTSLPSVIGPKVLRAYVIDSLSPPTETSDLTAQDKSVPLRFTLPAGGLSTLPALRLEVP